MNRRNLLTGLLVFVPALLLAQAEHHPIGDAGEPYFFHVTTPYFETLDISRKADGTLAITSLEGEAETQIYSKYTVYAFQPAFPNTKREHLQIVYRIAVNNAFLLDELKRYDALKYYDIAQYFPPKNAFYPNDYGTTSPVENLGADHPLTALDAMRLPEAWAITRGSPKVVIGISDTKIDSTYADLKGRVSKYLKYYDSDKGSTCSHGSTQASIIGAIMDNGVGMPGLCSECDLIANGYGNFDHIQELVEAGAKVINASWVLCSFGSKHKNVEERINEYYDEGILIVAGAGNSKRCNRYLRDQASNYGYPASYKRVISVTGVFGECGHYEDCITDDELYGVIANKPKDRHVRRQRMARQDSFDKLWPINGQWGMQHNLAIDVCVPVETYLPGRDLCEGKEDIQYGGATSTAASFVTGTIGLIWSANYCLGSAEVESVLKLTTEDIENLPGNEPYKMKLGAGRVDAYRAVKMAHDMQLEQGTVDVSGRDFYRFDFVLRSAPWQIAIENQRFRDSSTVDFTARKRIHLKPGTRLSPDGNGFVKLKTDPNLPTEECFPKDPPIRPLVEKDSVHSVPKFHAPFEIVEDKRIKGLRIKPVPGEVDSEYKVSITRDEEKIFEKTYAITAEARIPLRKIENERVEVKILTDLKRQEKTIQINRPEPESKTTEDKSSRPSSKPRQLSPDSLRELQKKKE